MVEEKEPIEQRLDELSERVARLESYLNELLTASSISQALELCEKKSERLTSASPAQVLLKGLKKQPKVIGSQPSE
jgi:cell division septum initiation protein DivIVA